jgi:hypothetical protein
MRQLLFTTRRDVMANGADGPDGADARGSVLDSELILIVRVPARPSRLKDISMPSMRSKAARDCIKPDEETRSHWKRSFTFIHV